MDAVSEHKETFFKCSFDITNNVFYGAGMVSGHIFDLPKNTFFYTGKFSGYLLKACQGFKAAIEDKIRGGRKLSIKYLVRGDTKVDSDAKEDFYLKLGRDIVELSKADLESENLTVIDTSKYKTVKLLKPIQTRRKK